MTDVRIRNENRLSQSRVRHRGRDGFAAYQLLFRLECVGYEVVQDDDGVFDRFGKLLNCVCSGTTIAGS